MILDRLPTDLIREMYSEWLLLKEVAKLDSAVCSETFRKWFTGQLIELPNHNTEDHDMRRNCLDWVIVRKIKLTKVILASKICYDGSRQLTEKRELNLSKKYNGRFRKDCLHLSLRFNPAPELVSWFVQSSTKLTSVNFTRNNKSVVNDDLLFQIAECCPSLQTLTLDHLQHISDAGVSRVAEKCSLLNCLSMDGTRVGNVAIAIVSQRCAHLTALSMRNCLELSSVGIASLATCVSTRVMILNLDRLQVLATSLNSLSNLLIHCGSTLRSLGLCQVRCGINMLDRLSESCKNLLTLDLSDCFQSTGSFDTLLKGCVLLQHLTLLRCALDPVKTVESMARHMTHLKSIKCWFSAFSDKCNQDSLEKKSRVI